MNCPNCQHEIADEVQICPNCGANVAPLVEAVTAPATTVASASSVINIKGAKKMYLIGSFFALCILALGYLAYIICNVALNGDFVASANFVSTMVGRVVISIIRATVLVSAVIAIISLFRAYKSKGDLFDNLSRLNYFTKALSIFAIFTLIDMFIMFFFLLIGNSVVGDTLTYKNNYELLDVFSKFAGYEGLNLSKEAFMQEKDSVGALVATIAFGLLAFAYSVYNAIVINKIRDYCDTLTSFAGGAQYDKDTKSPFVWILVLIPFYAVGFALSLMAGVVANALIQFGMLLLLICIAPAFRSLHSDLLKTSAD